MTSTVTSTETTTARVYRDCQDYYGSPKEIAQRQLWGKSHYCDDDTLRYFKSRILEVSTSDDGQLFGLIESLPLGSFDALRKYRVVIFDSSGHVKRIQDNAFATKKPAQRRLAQELE